MKTPFSAEQLVSRRAFLGGVAAIAAGAIVLRRGLCADAPAAKPNSAFGGVRIGCITYSYRGGKVNTGEETLKALIQDGLSECELMGGPIQSFASIGAKKGEKPTDADRQAQLAKCAELRKMYNDAGVTIHMEKMGFGSSDEEIDFNFRVAKALGCDAITLERPKYGDYTLPKKLAPFAEKHKIWVAFHNHTTNFPILDTPDPLLDCGQYIAFNFDTGHYVAGTKGLSPIPVLEKYHDRIRSLHLKDRTADQKNLPWGQGTTPIKEMLQLMKKEKWTFPGDIELEYKIPEGSDAVTEVGKCLQYCKEALA